MAEQKKEPDTGEEAVSIEEIQKTIEIDARDGRISREAAQRIRRLRASSGFFRNTTSTLKWSLIRFRHLFGFQLNSGVPAGDSNEADGNDSIVPPADIGVAGIEEMNLGIIDDDFRREGLIASGGQADIISAVDKQVGRVVAVKCLRDSYRKNHGASADLMQEAVLTARLEHPSIIPVYRLCRDRGENLHIVMKKIRGKTLCGYLDEIRAYYEKSRVRIFDERASLSRRLDIFLDICNGLGYAHTLKVVHCDLKPENIMIGFHHETYIIDWGIAKVMGEDGKVQGATQITGTPHYIAPEVVFGMDFDRRADIFAMGAMLFEIVTLRKAFPGKELKEVLENICTGNMNPLRHLYGIGIDKALVHIIRKATAIYPDARYQRIEDLAEDIRRYRSGLEIMAKPDNVFQHACRWMLIHKRLTRWVVQLFLIAVFGIIGFNTYEKMQFELLQKRRETSLNNATTNSLIVAMQINNQINKTEQIVSVLASEAAFILDHHPYEGGTESAGEVSVPFVSHAEMTAEKPPESSILSMHYNSRIDFTNLSYADSGKIPKAELEHYLLSLLPFKRQIVGLFILGCTDREPYVGKEAVRPENMEKSNYSLLWLHLNFSNGLNLRYPASESFGDDFDSRRCPWYLRAERNPDVVAWEQPRLEPFAGNKIIMTAAKAIVSPRQKFLGVAGVDIPLDEIRRIIEQDQSDKYFKKMLLLSDGRILINTANPAFQAKNDKNGRLILPQFHHQALFEEMTRKKFGFVSLQENGRETFYIYTYLEQMNWYYVVRVDQDTILLQGERTNPGS